MPHRHAIEEFDRLEALRQDLRNKPNFAETGTNETTCPFSETNPIPPENPVPAAASDPSPPTLGPRPPSGPTSATLRNKPNSRPPAPGSRSARAPLRPKNGHFARASIRIFNHLQMAAPVQTSL